MTDKHGDILIIVNGKREKFEEVVEKKLFILGAKVWTTKDSKTSVEGEEEINESIYKIGYKRNNDFIRVAYIPDERY